MKKLLLITICFLGILFVDSDVNAFFRVNNLIQTNRDGNTDKTKLLIHSDTTDGNTVFQDESRGNLIRSGLKQSFAYFDGSGDYLSVPDSEDWNLGAGNFTIDFWVKRDGTQTVNSGIIGQWGSTYAFLLSWGITNRVKFSINGDTSVMETASLDTEWNHIALVRDSATSTKLYLNGVQQGSTYTTNYTFTDSTDVLRIGYRSGDVMKGYLDEIRVSKGIARWTSNFTPPTEPYTSDANTQLLLHMNNKDISFTDSGNTGHTITANGNAIQTRGNGITVFGNVHHEVDQKKFGATSIYFDGSGDYLSIPDSADWDFGTGNFTVDFWVKRDGTQTVNSGIIGQWGSTYAFLLSWGITNRVKFSINGDVSVMETAGLDTEWNHIALVRDSATSTKLYLNGVQQGSTYTTNYTFIDSTDVLRIGYRSGDVIKGYLDEIRVSKGIARWTSNFTPPARPYSPYTIY